MLGAPLAAHIAMVRDGHALRDERLARIKRKPACPLGLHEPGPVLLLVTQTCTLSEHAHRRDCCPYAGLRQSAWRRQCNCER